MKEKYIGKIVKQLTCSKKRKEEIKKQLESDIDEALSTGEQIEDVISRMGEAGEIASAFNQSFSEEEQKHTVKREEINDFSRLQVFWQY